MTFKIPIVVSMLWLLGCRIDFAPAVSSNQLVGNVPTYAASSFDETGIAVIEPGIFTNECVYGDKASISDHAPVIYGDTATWNITNLVNHRKSHNGRAAFFTHRFRVNKDGTLVDAAGKPIFSDDKSETESANMVINEHYAERLKAIARKIKLLFVRHNLAHMALQEIPPDKLDKQGTNLRALFAKELAPELLFLPPSSPKPGERALDTALIVKTPTKFKANDANSALRVQAFCDRDRSHRIASAHFHFIMGAHAVSSLCASIDSFVSGLFAQGFQSVLVIGDFNVAAKRLFNVCASWTVLPIIKTTPGKGASCSNNQGGTSRKSIDSALFFRRPAVSQRIRVQRRP